MNNKKLLKEILEEAKQDLGITDKIRIELKPMKIKAASISLKKGVIRLNKNIISYLDREHLRYLILHELVHYKLKSKFHDSRFYAYINSVVDNSKARRLETEIIGLLLSINNFSNMIKRNSIFISSRDSNENA